MISLIVPVHNGEKHLENCLKSLENQSFSDFEVLIADNFSTDGTAEIANRFSKRDKRFRLISCRKKGVSHARNSGIAEAQGDYVFFLDSDDFLEDNALEYMQAAAKEKDADIIACNIFRIYKGKKSVVDNGKAAMAVGQEQIAKLFSDKLASYVMYNVFKLYKKAFLDRISLKFDEGLSLGEDLLFNLSAFEKANCVIYLNAPLYDYRVSDNGLNLKYRDDFAKIKLMLHVKIKEYLKKYKLLDRGYYAVAFNELYAVLQNEKKGGGKELKEVKELSREILWEQSPFKGLSPLKKAVFVYLKYIRRGERL